jgi:GDP-4-dehydro-6-deoxy-D-mannose reductase
LSGERVYQIREIVDLLRNLVNFDFEVEEDPELLRPADEPIIYGSSEKFKRETAWAQEIPLDQTLRDMLDFWRKNL